MAKRRQAGEGTIFFDEARQLWTARVSNPDGGKSLVKRSRDLKVIKKWFAETKTTIERGLPPEPSTSETVAAFLRRWIEVAKPRLKPRTYASYKQLIENHLVPALGKRPLRHLSPEHVQAFLNERGKGRKPRTMVHIHACLRVALRDAMRWGLVTRNVADRNYVELPPAPEAEIYPFTPAQAMRFLAAAEGGRYEQLYAVLLSTGLRLGEAQALRWCDIDLDVKPRPLLRVRHTLLRPPGEPWQLQEPKSRTSRRDLHLVMPALVALRAQRDRQAFERSSAGDAYVDHDFVFATPLGEPFTSSTAEKDFKRVLKRAGLEGTHRPHDLRHSCATYLLAAGVSEKEIMDILGHSNLAMTRHYEHVLDGMRAAAADRLETWLRTNIGTADAP